MLSAINNYFGFNRQQRNGLVVLICLSLFLLAVRIAYPYFLPPGSVEVMYLEPQTTLQAEKTAGNSELFVFDPNTATAEQLVALGFKEKTATTLIRYRRNHPFTRKEDLLSVYGISRKLFTKLEPFIFLGSPRVRHAAMKQSRPVSRDARQPQALIELNAADSTGLMKVKGIGPVFARRIIKYREMLGGFVNKEQLKEVYGLKEEAYSQIAPQVSADTSRIRKLDLNKDEFRVINRHPYISYEHTKAIFDMRRKTTITAENLRSIITEEADCRRLLPYLSF